jgi:glutaminase
MHNLQKPSPAALNAIMSILTEEPFVLSPVLREAAIKAANELRTTMIDTERAAIMKRILKETIEQNKLSYDDSTVRNFHEAVGYFGRNK